MSTASASPSVSAPSLAAAVADLSDLSEEMPALRSRRAGGRPQRDSRAWRAQVWISFGLAVALCAGGLAGLPGQSLDRAFMVMGYLFCLSTAFVLSKFVRDGEVAQQQVEIGEVAQQVVRLALVEEVGGAVQDQVGQRQGAHAGQVG